MSDYYTFQRDGNDIYCFISAEASDVKADQIKQAFEMSDHASAQLNSENVFMLVAQQYNDRRAQNKKLVASFSEPVATIVDASLIIEVTEDNMLATAHISAPHGGEPISRPQVLSELKAQGITTGVQRNAIDKALQHCLNGQPGEELSLPMARGVPPRKGRDTHFERLVADARNRILQPQEREDGTVDMRDLGQQITVNEGDPLMRRIPAESGRDGFTIKGVKLVAEDGENKELVAGTGSAISDDDASLLVATQVGMPWFTHNSANVDDVLTLKSVDVSTGHVDFKGSVVITGNVTEGMRVTATGDITVAGYVDSAVIEAGGNITVRKGCIGHISKEDEQLVQNNENFIPTLSSKLTCGGTIWCAYAQYVYIEAIQGISVDKQLTHCHVVTSGTAEIGGNNNQARGKIIGGTFETCAHIFAGQLGARAGTRTRFLLSSPPPDEETLATLDSLTDSFRDIMRKIKRLQLGLKRCEALTDEQQQQRHRKTLIKAIRQEQRLLSAYKDDIAVIKASIEKHPTLRITAAKEVFSGVVLSHERKKLQMKEHRNGTLFMLQDHQLRMDILR